MCLHLQMKMKYLLGTFPSSLRICVGVGVGVDVDVDVGVGRDIISSQVLVVFSL